MSILFILSKIAELLQFMENLRYIDQLGRGLPMVYQEATGNGKKVKFEEIGEEFKVSMEI